MSEAEKRIARELEDRIRCSVQIHNVWSIQGREMTRKYKLEMFPAFICIDGDKAVRVQSGGSVEQFLNSVRSYRPQP